MQIQVNGEPRDVDENLSLSELIAGLSLKPEQIAVELNRKVLRRLDWPGTTLRNDDKIEIVHFVGGGCRAGKVRVGNKFQVSQYRIAGTHAV
ncbi:MAG: sulfur carrier protein ThiS [Acidobacteriota bacterium]|nr:sulfur carrier protein ThiS [Acidobacteriota bacterium]